MISERIKQLVNYGAEKKLITEADRIYATNLLLDAMGEQSYEEPGEVPAASLEEILGALCDIAEEKGIIAEKGSVVRRDLFDTRLMGLLTPRPSEVIAKFRSEYEKSPEAATDFYYNFSRDTDYIRTYRVKKDIRWTVPSEFGEIDITINLSKPEKDPKDIALAKMQKQSSYPKCALCPENEGYAGNMSAAARENHRLIPITLGGEKWFFQYSPYVYYNEHCIALSAEHTPMNVCVKTVERMLDFIDIFPYYFIGSNAGLPIVGGSILTHDHMQGGRYEFAMERAEADREFHFAGFENVKAKTLKWPLSVIRISSPERAGIQRLAAKIFDAWSAYSDKSVTIFAETETGKHNAITPIARRRGGEYELDLVLRNNLTTPERPMGLYHPRPEYHNIKKENIGLIEVMGLAVLPSRLKKELAAVADAVLAGKNIADIPETAKHAAWFESFRGSYDITPENINDILLRETGNTFVRVLCDCGVFKRDEKGIAAFDRFIDFVNKF